jgi:GNAT superfamily N-acetyltransferase
MGYPPFGSSSVPPRRKVTPFRISRSLNRESAFVYRAGTLALARSRRSRADRLRVPRTYSDPVTTVRLATLDDLPQIAHVQMRAFEDDPLITWMLPPDNFDRRATLLFDCMIRASMVHQSIYTTDDGVCTAVWAPPEAWAFSEEQIEMMSEPFAEAAGERVDRALGVLIEMAEVHPSEPHWYLEGLGTHPDWQRRGIASAVLAPVLGKCDADGLPAYLETQRESNVPFYRRHGFEVIGMKQLSNGAPNMWLMWREVRL